MSDYPCGRRGGLLGRSRATCVVLVLPPGLWLTYVRADATSPDTAGVPVSIICFFYAIRYSNDDTFCGVNKRTGAIRRRLVVYYAQINNKMRLNWTIGPLAIITVFATQKLQQMLEKTLLWRIYLRDSENFLRSLYAAYSISAVRRWRSFQQRTYCSISPKMPVSIGLIALPEMVPKYLKAGRCLPVTLYLAYILSSLPSTWRPFLSGSNEWLCRMSSISASVTCANKQAVY